MTTDTAKPWEWTPGERLEEPQPPKHLRKMSRQALVELSQKGAQEQADVALELLARQIRKVNKRYDEEQRLRDLADIKNLDLEKAA
jgi:hypothetical protein